MNPSNLMIDSNYSIKLADFGLAQRFSQSMNMMNSFVGTLVYSRFLIIFGEIYYFLKARKLCKINHILKKLIFGHLDAFCMNW